MRKKNCLANDINRIKKILDSCDITTNSFLKQHGICFVMLLLCTVISIYSPSFIGNLIDSVQNVKYSQIVYNLIALIILSSCSIFMSYLQARKYNRFENNLNANIREGLMKKITNVEFDFWSKNSIGNIETILDKDVLQFNNFIVLDTSNFIRDVLSFIGIAAYIIWVDLKIGIIIIGLTLFFVIIQRIYAYPLNKQLRLLKEIETKTNTYSNDILNNHESYFLKDNIENAYVLYKEMDQRLFDETFCMKNKYQISAMISQVFNIVSIIIILAIWILDKNIQLSSGELVNIILYTQKLYVPLFKIGEIFIKYKNFKILLNRLDNIVETSTIKYGTKILSQITDIRFSNLTKVVGGNLLFNGFNGIIKRGEILGLTGANGSGKTTLVKLLRRYDSVYQGEIFVNGININELNKSTLLNCISVMPQKVTVSTEDLAEVTQYVRRNSLQNFVDVKKIEQKNLYNYTMKSGGELQKISFIKTILDDKSVLIFDEPSSSLDGESEIYIGEILKKIRKNKIIIIITHRKYLLSLCDEIIDFSNKT